jgi:hypothetical protein
MTSLLGTHFYLGPRQHEATAAVARRVGRLSCVEPVNIQRVDDAYDVGGLETVAVLKQDSRTVTGPPLRMQIAQMFGIERTLFSPLRFSGGWFSSQVWFVCRPRP